MSKSSKALHPIFASLFAFAFLANTSISEATTLEKIQTSRVALWEPTKKQIQFVGLFDTQDIPYYHDPAIAKVDRNSQSGGITVRRIHVTWAPNFHSPGAMDFMGSPQWIFHVFGQEAADWMGVRLVNDTTMTIFDGERARNIVHKVNEQMIKMGFEPLPINFYHYLPIRIFRVSFPISDCLPNREISLSPEDFTRSSMISPITSRRLSFHRSLLN